MFCERMQNESCLVKAPVSHADESVQVMSEPKCTSVQADKKNVRVKCAHVGTIRAKIITCSPFCSEQLINDYSYSRCCGFELFFQLKLQLQAGSLHGIIFQFRSQPRSRYGERP